MIAIMERFNLQYENKNVCFLNSLKTFFFNIYMTCTQIIANLVFVYLTLFNSIFIPTPSFCAPLHLNIFHIMQYLFRDLQRLVYLIYCLLMFLLSKTTQKLISVCFFLVNPEIYSYLSHNIRFLAHLSR